MRKIGISKKSVRENIEGWLMVLLPVIGFALFHLIPMALSGWLSFTELKSFRLSDAKWIGLENYKNIFTDPLFYKSLVNTLYFCLSIFISLVLSLLIVVLISGNICGKRFFRTVFFIPYVCSVVAISIMWQWMYEPYYGIINTFLSQFGIEKIHWLSEESLFMPCVIIMQVWSSTGFYIIFFQAAFGRINKEYYEAAQIEGASAGTQFFKITLPMVSPTTFYLLVIGLIGGLQAFSQIQTITGGSMGPDYAGLTLVFYLYQKAFEDIISYGMGIASAAAWLSAIVIMGVTFINFKLSKWWVHYD